MKLATGGDIVKTSGGRTANCSCSPVAGFAVPRQPNGAFSTSGFQRAGHLASAFSWRSASARCVVPEKTPWGGVSTLPTACCKHGVEARTPSHTGHISAVENLNGGSAALRSLPPAKVLLSCCDDVASNLLHISHSSTDSGSHVPQSHERSFLILGLGLSPPARNQLSPVTVLQPHDTRRRPKTKPRQSQT